MRHILQSATAVGLKKSCWQARRQSNPGRLRGALGVLLAQVFKGLLLGDSGILLTASLLKIHESVIGIKATTTERMGIIGRGNGIAVYAIAALEKMD